MAEKTAQDISVFDGSQWKTMKGSKIFDGSQWKDFKGVASDNSTFHTIENDIIKDTYIQKNAYPTGQSWKTPNGYVDVNNPTLFDNTRKPPTIITKYTDLGNAVCWPLKSFMYFTSVGNDLLKDFVVCIPFIHTGYEASQLCSIWTENYLDFQFFYADRALEVTEYIDGFDQQVYGAQMEAGTCSALWLYLEKTGSATMGGNLSMAFQHRVLREQSLRDFYPKFINKDPGIEIMVRPTSFAASTAIILGNIPFGQLDNDPLFPSRPTGIAPLNVYFFDADNLK